MPHFTLPDGYSFESPTDGQEPATLSATVPDKGYGGADISQAWDAAGVHYVGCNAWGPGTPSFRWRVFRFGGAGYVEVPLPFLATGRGELAALPHDGALHAIAWTDSTFQFDSVPGFAVFPSIPALERRIAALEARVAAVTSKAANIETLMHRVEEEGVRTKWAVQALSTRVDSIDAGALTDEELAKLRIVRGG